MGQVLKKSPFAEELNNQSIIYRSVLIDYTHRAAILAVCYILKPIICQKLLTACLPDIEEKNFSSCSEAMENKAIKQASLQGAKTEPGASSPLGSPLPWQSRSVRWLGGSSALEPWPCQTRSVCPCPAFPWSFSVEPESRSNDTLVPHTLSRDANISHAMQIPILNSKYQLSGFLAHFF